MKKIGHERGSGRERESEQGRAREEIRPSPCAPDGTVAGMGGTGARVSARAGRAGSRLADRWGRSGKDFPNFFPFSFSYFLSLPFFW